MLTRDQLLEFERHTLIAWLSCFDFDDCNVKPTVGIGPSKETLWIRNFPLPAKYVPDKLNVIVEIKNYPFSPPKGIYLLTTQTNQSLIEQLRLKFNLFQSSAFHGAAPMDGFTWICIGYSLQRGEWKFNAKVPHKGDNICKLFQHFWRLLEEE
jgi:hypothetical protein